MLLAWPPLALWKVLGRVGGFTFQGSVYLDVAFSSGESCVCAVCMCSMYMYVTVGTHEPRHM